jgi:hypothetical protein
MGYLSLPHDRIGRYYRNCKDQNWIALTFPHDMIGSDIAGTIVS